jgi:hypothetical protein
LSVTNRLIWVQLLGEGHYQFNFEYAIDHYEAIEFLWPEGQPDGVDVTMEGIGVYVVTGLTESARQQMRDEIGAWVLTADSRSYREASREARQDDAALDEVHPVLGITPRQMREQGWWGHMEVNDHFVWIGYDGQNTDFWVVQTYPYSEDDSTNRQLRMLLEQGMALDAALREFEAYWEMVLRLMVVNLAARSVGAWETDWDNSG